MASITVCDKCGEQRQRSQYQWFELTLADTNRNPAEPPIRYDLCLVCARSLAAQQEWILFT